MKPSRLAVLFVICLAGVAAAQFRGGRFFRQPARFATAESFGRGFNFCRGAYTSRFREAGGQGWSTDYPDGDKNFSVRLGELTRTRVATDERGQPDHLVVRLTDETLFQCGYLHLEDVGTAELTEGEVMALRNYLLKGGFVWCDDWWGSAAWSQWMSQLGRILPAGEYPVVEIPPDDPILRTLFDVKRIPQIPSIQFWRTSGGRTTSERGADSARAEFHGIRDRRGNLMLVMTHNTDITDAWEREGEDPRFFYAFSPDGYQVGIDIVLYALTH